MEELTLYATDQNKKISAQQNEMDIMKKEINLLRKLADEIAELKSMFERLRMTTPATKNEY